ncbi:hypothetical protein Hanom_Chr03g00232631 [Helianthus anomalus]
MVGLGLRACRLACRGLPFGQWVSRTKYTTILMLEVQKKKYVVIEYHIDLMIAFHKFMVVKF